MENCRFNSDILKRMKTSHLKIVSTWALAAGCFMALGLASALRAQPVYSPIDLSTNPPAATTTATNAPAAADTTATTAVSTNDVSTNAPAPVAAAPAAAPA